MDRLLYTPAGVQDDLPDACRAIQALEARAEQIFAQWGYEPVAPAVVEHMEVFTNQVSAFPQEAMFKFCDQEGRLLVLGPISPRRRRAWRRPGSGIRIFCG